MMMPHFLRFYQGYTASTLLEEFAITFFALVNAMYRIKAEEALTLVHANSIPHMERTEAQSAVDKLIKASRGLQGIIEEVRVIKGK